MATVLIVEDEPDVLKVIKARVESKGHSVITAVNGVKALEILKKELPDLIISDVLMPEMDGFQLYKELKQNPKTEKIPVLILTARGKMEDTFRVIGVDEFISKPFETEDFLKKVVNLLQHQTGHAEKPTVVDTATAKTAPVEPPAPLQVVANTQKGLRVLVAGSVKDIVSKIEQQLKKEGIVVEVALAGMDVISKNNAFQPSLILLDILCSDIPADEIVAKLRYSSSPDKTSIVLYSIAGHGSGEDIQERIMSIDAMKINCLAAGATEYVGSFQERTFLAAILRYLK